MWVCVWTEQYTRAFSLKIGTHFHEAMEGAVEGFAKNRQKLLHGEGGKREQKINNMYNYIYNRQAKRSDAVKLYYYYLSRTWCSVAIAFAVPECVCTVCFQFSSVSYIALIKIYCAKTNR